MNFKIVEYHCGCKYIFTDAMPRPRVCLEHNSVQKMVTLWCQDCGIKVEVIPLAGRRQRCLNCSEYKTKKDVKRWAQKKYNENQGIEDEAIGETLGEKDERQLNDWYKSCQYGLKLKIPETLLLDRWLNENSNCVRI